MELSTGHTAIIIKLNKNSIVPQEEKLIILVKMRIFGLTIDNKSNINCKILQNKNSELQNQPLKGEGWVKLFLKD